MTAQASAAEDLLDATKGFDLLFADDISGAKVTLEKGVSPFHYAGVGVTIFLQAALGLERDLVPEASRHLSIAEQKAKEATKKAKSTAPTYSTRFRKGLEWEVLQADAVVLNGLTHALNESYLGYIHALSALNSAQSKFSKLFQTTFPNGLDSYDLSNVATESEIVSKVEIREVPAFSSPPDTQKHGIFGKWATNLSTPKSSKSPTRAPSPVVDGPIDEFIVAGTAFGFGIFTLVFSLLPSGIKNVVGWFGIKSDRKLALRALQVAATKKDVHSMFAALTLMSYHGITLLLAGWLADESQILCQYQDMLAPIEARYPTGSLWILNKAKILRMTKNSEQAIEVLQKGVSPGRPGDFRQADALLMFELAWALLGQRRYDESGEVFLKLTEMNKWSHATYYYIAAGCFLSAKQIQKAANLLDKIPDLLDKKKSGGRNLPTEVFIRKKLAFYKKKQERKTGGVVNYVQAMKINAAEEMAIFWNLHSRLPQEMAESRIRDLWELSPPPRGQSPYANKTTSDLTASTAIDLDTSDELALRDLLLGIIHRTTHDFACARYFLLQVIEFHTALEGKWMVPIAAFELAVLELMEVDATPQPGKEIWAKGLKSASLWLDKAAASSNNTIDLSNRLDTRITLLRDQISLKWDTL